jgi:hypothetical protein
MVIKSYWHQPFPWLCRSCQEVIHALAAQFSGVSDGEFHGFGSGPVFLRVRYSGCYRLSSLLFVDLR